jgi:hypothetical protein
MTDYIFIKPVEITTINGHILSRNILQNLNCDYVIGCNIKEIIDDSKLKKYEEETKNEMELLKQKINEFESYEKKVESLFEENALLFKKSIELKINEIMIFFEDFFEIAKLEDKKNDLKIKRGDLLDKIKNTNGEKKFLGKEMANCDNEIKKIIKFIGGTNHNLTQIKGELTHLLPYFDFGIIKGEYHTLLKTNKEYIKLDLRLGKIYSQIDDLTVEPWDETLFLKILETQQDICICEPAEIFYTENKINLKLGDKISIKKDDISYVLFGNIKLQKFETPAYWTKKNYTKKVIDLINKNTIVRILVKEKLWYKYYVRIIGREGDTLYGYTLNYSKTDHDVYNYVKPNCIYKFGLKAILELQYYGGQIDKKLGSLFEHLYKLNDGPSEDDEQFDDPYEYVSDYSSEGGEKYKEETSDIDNQIDEHYECNSNYSSEGGEKDVK